MLNNRLEQLCLAVCRCITKEAGFIPFIGAAVKTRELFKGQDLVVLQTRVGVIVGNRLFKVKAVDEGEGIGYPGR